MELQELIEPAHVRKWGEQIIILAHPSNIKIVTTGPGAQTIINEGPPNGKTWQVLIRVEAVETDG